MAKNYLAVKRRFETKNFRVMRIGDRAPLSAFDYSDDHGRTWRKVSLCTSCKAKIEPPGRLKPLGPSGTLRCDWCPVLNELYGKN